MPQLNPSPWFFIFLLSWAILLVVFKTKILSTITTTQPSPTSMTKQQMTPWNWPWT